MSNKTTKAELPTSAQIATKPCYVQPFFTLRNQDCLNGLLDIASESVDVILTDPPYKYLKNQKLEVDFDESIFFNEAKRVLKKDGFIVMFGRGVSFYRWNMILDSLGFVFKEEIIWDKIQNSSPCHAVSRVHETVSIFCKSKNNKIKISKIPYTESKEFKIQSIIDDIKRIKSALNNTEGFDRMLKFLETNERDYTKFVRGKTYNTSVGIHKLGFRDANCLNSIVNGMLEKTIIQVNRNHYHSIHPTEKPVRLLERLLNLVSNEGDVVLDPFSGSCSTGVACRNVSREFIGFEIDREYYDQSVERISAHTVQQKLF